MISSANTPSARATGFTLVEIVVTIVLVGLLAMAAVPILKSGIDAYETTTTGLETLSKLRYATERMAREIREVRRNPGAPADFQITTPLAAGSLSFVKRDGNRVTLTAAAPNATLAYQTPAASGVLTDQVTSLVFRYYTINGVTQTASIAGDTLAFIEVDLTLSSDAGTTLRQRTRVALRNQ
jgi:prepilin-type N-terminal cleavage/methylation domain-containing protein